ncbi:peptidyl-prolyl cis-trans isomerase [Cohnella sp. WQ 127256]|uniref:peptidyl-prolyl cis-trans isomerase n=1 Tax=Cohnella sp. WQ 127256 TaxID=2938790 RepID=UPI0021173B38|nr:peptidyl-prolyl cis-trans isomerase [Cohnella sp. WQ 127256]
MNKRNGLKLASKRDRKRMARIYLILGSAVMIIVTLIISAWMLQKPSDVVDPIGSEEIIAAVNGEPITYGEFNLRFVQNRAVVLNYFKNLYNMDYDASFWTRSDNEEVPIEKWKSLSLEEVVKIKLQQLLAKQNDLVSSVSYEDFVQSLAVENKRRKQAELLKEVIYGPLQYDEQGYYNYLLSNMRTRMQNKLAEQFPAANEQLMDYYEIHKGLFRIKGTVITEVTELSLNTFTMDSASLLFKQINEKLEKGQTFKEAVEELDMKLTIREFSPLTERENAMIPNLTEMAFTLNVGQTSEVVIEGNKAYLLHCISKDGFSYRPFAEVKKAVEQLYYVDLYSQTIDKLSKEAEIEINRDVFDRVVAE